MTFGFLDANNFLFAYSAESGDHYNFMNSGT